MIDLFTGKEDVAGEAHRAALRSLQKLRGTRHNSQKELAGMIDSIMAQHDLGPTPIGSDEIR
jgi:hypothetical protein